MKELKSSFCCILWRSDDKGGKSAIFLHCGEKIKKGRIREILHGIEDTEGTIYLCTWMSIKK